MKAGIKLLTVVCLVSGCDGVEEASSESRNECTFDTMNVCDNCDLTVDWSGFSLDVDGEMLGADDIRMVSTSVFLLSQDKLVSALCDDTTYDHYLTSALALPDADDSNYLAVIPIDSDKIREDFKLSSDDEITFTISLVAHDDGLVLTRILNPSKSVETYDVSY